MMVVPVEYEEQKSALGETVASGREHSRVIRRRRRSATLFQRTTDAAFPPNREQQVFKTRPGQLCSGVEEYTVAHCLGIPTPHPSPNDHGFQRGQARGGKIKLLFT